MTTARIVTGTEWNGASSAAHLPPAMPRRLFIAAAIIAAITPRHRDRGNGADPEFRLRLRFWLELLFLLELRIRKRVGYWLHQTQDANKPASVSFYPHIFGIWFGGIPAAGSFDAPYVVYPISHIPCPMSHVVYPRYSARRQQKQARTLCRWPY